MPSPRTRTESRLLWIAVAGLWINALYWSLSMIERSSLPQTYDGYLYRHDDIPAEWVFPTDDVATWICAIAVEALFASVLLRRVTGHPAGLCLCTAVLYGMATMVMAPMAIHGRTTVAHHVIALFFAAGWLFAMFLAATVYWLVKRYLLDDDGLEVPAPPEVRVVAGGKASKR
jgi:hypothetical protein